MSQTAAAVVVRLREMIARGMVLRDAAKQTGVSWTTAWRIKTGRTHKVLRVQKMELSSLGLTRANGKRCRSCGDPMQVKTFDGFCVECKVVKLDREGLVRIAEC